MKKIIVLVFAALLGNSVIAQKTYSNDEFTVKFGFPYEIPKGHQDLGYFGNAETGFAQVSYQPQKELTIQNFDKNLKAGKEKTIDIKNFPDDFMSDTLFVIGDKYFWFFSTFDKADRKESLWVQELNLSKGELTGKRVELLKNTELEGELISLGGFKIAKGRKYQFHSSLDSSKLLINYRMLHKSKNDAVSKEQVGFCVIDEKLKIIDKNLIDMPYTEKRMDIADYNVDSQGNSFLLAKVFGDGENKEKNKKKQKYHYEVFRIQHGTGELKNIKLETETKFITNILTVEQKTGDIVIGGFYSNKKQDKDGGWHFGDDKNSSDGVFLVKIDKEGKAVNYGKGYFEFPAEIIKQYMSARQQKKLDKKEEDDDLEAKNMVMRYIVTNSDGSTEVIGEEYAVKVRGGSNVSGMGGGSSTTTYYEYEDILDMRVDADGQMVWIKKIPKRQLATTTGYGSQYMAAGTKYMMTIVGSMSFYRYAKGETTYLFYTDNIKNLNLPLDKEPALHRDGAGGYLMYYKIDKEGNVSKGDLFDYKKEGIKFKPVEFQNIGKKTLVNRAFKGKQSRVVVITQK
ncbi:MAG: hypothetical protein IPP32_06930 [Bacteroidetes bacterium]|nr:hypothetical protein [Bacteroidota bacterium]